MQPVSLASLTDLAGRAEQLAERLLQLDLRATGARLPPPPMPLELEGAEEWVASIDEWLRRPRRARSKQLLESKGIDTSSIPASVLDAPDPLAEIMMKLDALPPELQPIAYVSVGRALTKGTEDAFVIADRYSTTADAISKLKSDTVDHAWLHSVALQAVSESPDAALATVNDARRVLQLIRAVEQRGIGVTGFATLADASQALSDFNTRFAAYHQVVDAEGVAEEAVGCHGLDAEEALRRFDDHRQQILNEKRSLQENMTDLAEQLQAIGGVYTPRGERLADIRCNIVELQGVVDQQRAKLRESLGAEAFTIIERLLQGEHPQESEVTDAQFGSALRRALSCGYKMQMEPPHESK